MTDEKTARPVKLVILVTGHREWSKGAFLRSSLHGLVSTVKGGYFTVLLVQGTARGADTMCKQWAIENGVEHKDFPVTDADWKRLGKQAGNLRNQAMVDFVSGVIKDRVICVAFKNGLTPDLIRGGTEDCVKRALSAGFPVYHIEEISI